MSTEIMAGNVQDVAFAASRLSGVGVRPVLGRFTMWIGSQMVGDEWDTVLLGNVQLACNHSIEGCGKRDFRIIGLRDPTDIIRDVVWRVHDVGGSGRARRSVSEVVDDSMRYRDFDLSDIGGSSFDEVFLVAVEFPEYDLLVWSDRSFDSIRSSKVPAGRFCVVLKAFASGLGSLVGQV